jgi:hypothetical protein
VLSGSALDVSSLAAGRHEHIYPRGLQLALTPRAAGGGQVDTLVMSNLGYFQLQAAPGLWDLTLAPGGWLGGPAGGLFGSAGAARLWCCDCSAAQTAA